VFAPASCKRATILGQTKLFVFWALGDYALGCQRAGALPYYLPVGENTQAAEVRESEGSLKWIPAFLGTSRVGFLSPILLNGNFERIP
jgi:hypothetical protein